MIHQISFDLNDVYKNPEITDNIENLKKLNPGWTHKLWDEKAINEYILLHYGPEILNYYHRISPLYASARSDLFRYLVIYREGGLYLDLKSSVLRPLDEKLQEGDRYIIAYWDKLPGSDEIAPRISPDTPRGFIMTWYVFATKGHPMVKKVITEILKNIDKYNPFSYGVGMTGAFNFGGPTMYTKVLLDNIKKHPDIKFDYFIQDWGGCYSVFKDSNTHSNKLSNNYRTQTTPIVWNISGLGSALFKIYYSIRK